MSDLAHLKKRLGAAFDATETGWGNPDEPGRLDPFERFHDMRDNKRQVSEQASVSPAARTGGLLLSALAFIAAAIALCTDQGEVVFFVSGALMAIAGIFLVQHVSDRLRSRAAAVAPRLDMETAADREWTEEEKRGLLNSIHDSLGDIALVRDRDGRILAFNTILSDITGREDLQGETLAGLGFSFRPALRSGRLIAALETADGTRLFTWDEVVVRDPATRALVVQSVGRDITEENRNTAVAEEARLRAEQASAAKSRLLATVAHEVRTPLTGLLGMAALLENSPLAANQRNYVAGLRQSGQVLSHLVEDLLDFATMEAGRFELRPVAEPPRALIEGIVEMLAPRAHFKGLEIASFIAPDVPDLLSFDPGRLRQVLFNVAGNAVKFTERGGVSVAAEMEGRMLVLRIGDTGPGMTAEEKGRIFEEFVQVGSAEARSNGKGLGLSISARIIEAFGGTLTVDSVLGSGSTFTIRIPAIGDFSEAAADFRSRRMAGARVLLLAPKGPAEKAIQRTIRAFGGLCIACDNAPDLFAAMARGESDGRPFTDIIVDHRLERQYIGELALATEAAGLRRVFLVNPEERQARISGPYDAWLIRPLREQSLVDVLTGKLRGLERRGATNDNLPDAGRHQPAWRDGGLSILLGEDDPVNALLVQTTLERAGHSVRLAGDFAALREALAERPRARIDLLITDLNMPGGEGVEFMTDLRRRERADGLPPLPALVLSGETADAVRQAVLAAGADRVLVKPVSPGELLAEIRGHRTGFAGTLRAALDS